MLKTCAQITLLLLALTGGAQAQSTPTPSPSPGASGRQVPVQNEELGEGEVLRISANLVSVPVTVVNRQGQYVVDLRQQDFHVFEDNKEQTIVHFSNVDQPFSVILLIDTSGSTAPFLDQIKGAAKALVDQLRPADTVRPVYFHGEIKSLTAEGLSDRKLFDAAIDRIESGPPNMGTRLYDAVAFGLGALKPVATRRAVILLSDGENTWGKATMKGTLREAEESGVVVYTVQFGDLQPLRHQASPQIYLQQLAERTGGRYFKGGDMNAIKQSFVEVAKELRRQYVLGYEPNEPERIGLRRIRVKVNRKQVAVRARSSYTYTR